MSFNVFNSTKVEKPQSNFFDLSHDVKMSGKGGWLMPTCAIDAIPGDRYNLSTQIMARMAPMIAPPMHRVDVAHHWFAVPKRLVWENFPKWISPESEVSIPPQAPYINTADLSAVGKRLYEYLGVPENRTALPLNGENVDAMVVAAFNLIWNEWFRDQDLQQVRLPDQCIDGLQDENFYNNITLPCVNWAHDYFTAARPWPQKGDDVTIPFAMADTPVRLNTTVGATTIATGTSPFNATAIGSSVPTYQGTPSNANLFADTSAMDNLATINDLRTANAVQRWLERLSTGGSRYIEYIKKLFGVTSSDARLQRPEYITGFRMPIAMTEVLNTAGVTGSNPQGAMSGHGLGVDGSESESYFCEEHMFIIGVMYVVPKPAYQQGIPKQFQKFDPLDVFNPLFAHLGEQAIRNSEIYAYSGQPDDPFGYIPRYSEYRYMANRSAGDFCDSLDEWTMTRIFDDLPVLDEDFIKVEPNDFIRNFIVQDDTDNLWFHIVHDVMAQRLIPTYGTPRL